MAEKKNKIPSVLMLILSTLGILISVLVTAIAFVSLYGLSPSYPVNIPKLPILTTGMLSFFIALLNIPALILSIKSQKVNCKLYLA